MNYCQTCSNQINPQLWLNIQKYANLFKGEAKSTKILNALHAFALFIFIEGISIIRINTRRL